MFCTNCGSELIKDANFCANCGTRVSLGQDTHEFKPKPVKLAQLPGDLNQNPIKIRNAKIIGPDRESEVSISIDYEIENNTQDIWEHVGVRTIILDSNGRLVDHTDDEINEVISSGEKSKQEAWFGGLKASEFSGTLENAQIIVHMTASKATKLRLGTIKLPEPRSNSAVRTDTIQHDAVQVMGGVVSCGEPDGDDDCRLEFRFLLQNTTLQTFPIVKLEATVIDKDGEEIITGGSREGEELRAGSLEVFQSARYVSKEDISEATADIAITIYTPCSSALAQHLGFKVEAAEDDDVSPEKDEHDLTHESHSGSEAQFITDTRNIQTTSASIRSNVYVGREATKDSLHSVFGNLFKVTLGRISGNWSIEVNDGLVYATDPSTLGEDSSTTEFGIAWSEMGLFVVNRNGSKKFDDNDCAMEYIEQLLKEVCNDNELEEAKMIVSVQEDADYGWLHGSRNNWKISLGNGGEVRLKSKDYRGSLVINVLPYYKQTIDLTALPYGEADGEPEDRHEFCGVMRALKI